YLIEEGDAAVWIGCDDCIADAVQGGLQPVPGLADSGFAFAQPFFRTLAFGNVDDGGQNELTLAGGNRVQGDFDRNLAAVLTQAKQVSPGSHRSGRGRLCEGFA